MRHIEGPDYFGVVKEDGEILALVDLQSKLLIAKDGYKIREGRGDFTVERKDGKMYLK